MLFSIVLLLKSSDNAFLTVVVFTLPSGSVVNAINFINKFKITFRVSLNYFKREKFTYETVWPN